MNSFPVRSGFVPHPALKWSAILFAALLTIPTLAQAQELGAEPDEVEEAPPARPHWLAFEFGTRLTMIGDHSFDPYAEDDVLPQALAGASFMPLSFGPFALGIATEYDFGRVGSQVRGQETSLAMHRFAGGLQAQVDLWRLQLYARGMAAALHALGSIDESGAVLDAAGTTWGVDVAGGVRFRLGSSGANVVSYWLLAEGGYAFAGDIDMAFAPAADGARQFGAVTLPALHPAGGTARIAFALSFL